MTDKLKALALAANRICNIKAEPIMWFTQDEILGQTFRHHTDDAAYIAAASPDAILALLKRAEDAEAELALRIAEIDSLNIDKGHMRAEVERLKAIENGLSTCKRMREASTAEDWKRIAEHLEWQWSSCSTFANKVAGERDTALAELARLKSITQFKCGVDYADNLLTVTVARLAHDGVVEIIHCEQIDLASGAAQKEPTSDSELAELCIQWFNAVQDLNPTYLETADFELAKKLYERVGRRVPSSIYNGIASGAAHTSKTIDVKWHHDLAKKETDRG